MSPLSMESALDCLSEHVGLYHRTSKLRQVHAVSRGSDKDSRSKTKACKSSKMETCSAPSVLWQLLDEFSDVSEHRRRADDGNCFHQVRSDNLEISALATFDSDRKKAVDWFCALPLTVRKEICTIMDGEWTRLVLKMKSKIECRSQGTFLVLPDILEEPCESNIFAVATDSSKDAKPIAKCKGGKHSSSPDQACSLKPASPQLTKLPSLAFKEKEGLHARIPLQDEAESILLQCLRFIPQIQSGATNQLSLRQRGFGQSLQLREQYSGVTIGDDLLERPVLFLSLLDQLAWGQLLKQWLKSSSISDSWEELPWLQAMGHYSLAAYVTNKLDISLSRAWSSRPVHPLKQPALHGSCKKGRRTAGGSIALLDSGRPQNCDQLKEAADWWVDMESTSDVSLVRTALTAGLKAEVSLPLIFSSLPFFFSLCRAEHLSLIFFLGAGCCSCF